MTGVQPLTKAITPSTSPTMTAFVFIAAPPPYSANDFLTIKRKSFTKVTKRKPGDVHKTVSAAGKSLVQLSPQTFSETRPLSPSVCAGSFAESYRPRQKCDNRANVPVPPLTLTEGDR